jgi:hypothetical protein
MTETRLKTSSGILLVAAAVVFSHGVMKIFCARKRTLKSNPIALRPEILIEVRMALTKNRNIPPSLKDFYYKSYIQLQD